MAREGSRRRTAAAPSGRTSAPTSFPGFGDVAADLDAVVGALTRRRTALGVSQTVVAARMGTSQSAVARLEAGRSDLRLSTLERYAAALDTSIGYVVGPHPSGGAA